MKNILITGSNGFIARELINRLEEYPSYNLLKTNRDTLDITDPNAVKEFFNLNDVDYIIHTAIGGGRRTKIDTSDVVYNNLLMFENLVRHRDKYECMISFGSGAELNNPTEYYGFSKSLIAKRIESINDNILNLRIWNVFGELEEENRMIKNNVNNYIKGNDIVIHQDKWMDFFGVNDLFKVIKYIIDIGYKTLPNKTLDMCYAKKYRLSDIANLINNLSDTTSKVAIMKSGEGDWYSGNGFTGAPSAEQIDGLELDGLENSIRGVYEIWNKKRH